jgi:putative endonuclease
MAAGWVYFLTNRPNSIVTDDLVRRAWEHRAGVAQGFT